MKEIGCGEQKKMSGRKATAATWENEERVEELICSQEEYSRRKIVSALSVSLKLPFTACWKVMGFIHKRLTIPHITKGWKNDEWKYQLSLLNDFMNALYVELL